MEDLLEQINQTIESCMEGSSEETKLQLKIIKGNINTLFQEYKGKEQRETNVPEVPQNTASQTENTTNKKNILVVDDSSIVRNYLEKLLNEKYQISMAENGKIAIDMLSPEEPNIDAILLDLMMPEIDGFGVLEYLAGRNLNIPVIIISGDNTKETINRAFEYHVVDIIEKPFDSKTIEAKIERIL